MKKEKDPMGNAVAEYYAKGEKGKERIVVYSPMFDEDEIPVQVLFRQYNQMPPLEQKALQLAKGKILDVGACAGCHSLVLQEMNKNVTAIDISPLCVETMQKRGVKEVRLLDFWNVEEQYDTILMLMNGIGIVGNLTKLSDFFSLLDKILTPEGSVYLDSSDLCYLYEDEEGIIELPNNNRYYGEIDYQMQYKTIIGDKFPWLYLDADTLQEEAIKHDFIAKIIKMGEHYDYLAEIKRKNSK